MKRIIIIVILVIVVIGGFIGYRMYKQETPDLAGKDPDISVDAKTLIEAFDRDTAAAGKKYLDKLLEVTGIVKTADSSSIVLGEAGTESSVVCGFDRRHSDDYKKVQAGAIAIVQGRCTGYAKGEEMLGVSLGTTVQLSFADVKTKK